MRVPISGIVTGFRLRKGTTKDAGDFGILDILQAGDKDFDSSLIFVYVQDVEMIDYLLTNYASGTLRWIDAYCQQVQSGRELVWILKKIFSLRKENIAIEGVVNG